MALDCLNTLVGLSDTEDSCYQDAPLGASDSTTGYFLTDAEYGFSWLEAIYNAGGNTAEGFWNLLTKSRSSAIAALKTDLQALIRNYNVKALEGWKGTVGKVEAVNSYIPGKDFIGLGLSPVMIRDAYLFITDIYTGLNNTGTVTLTISSNDPAFTAITKTLDTEAGRMKKTAFADAIALPFYSETVPDDELWYYFTYEHDGNAVYRNRFTCCGNNQGWMQYIKAKSLIVDEVTSDMTPSGDGNANGLALVGYIGCNELDFLCSIDTLGAWNLKSLIGRAIQTKAAAYLISEVLEKGAINNAALNTEALFAMRSTRNKVYKDNLNWIAANFPAESTGCFACKKGANFRKTSLMV